MDSTEETSLSVYYFFISGHLVVYICLHKLLNFPLYVQGKQGVAVVNSLFLAADS